MLHKVESTHPEVGDGFEQALESIAERIREQEKIRRRIANVLAGLRGIALGDGGFAEEPSIVKKVEMDRLGELTVAGIDGGLLEQQLHGLDLILVRAIAAIFHYCDGELKWARYFPGEVPLPKLIDVSESLDTWEFELLAGMERQLAEIELAADALKVSGADVVMLDGSVVPQYIERFPSSTILLERYQKLISAYTELYSSCSNMGAILIGVVKDSRGGRFVDILKKSIITKSGDLGLDERDLAMLGRSRDTVLLDHLLRVGERTPAFTYAEKPAGYVLRDLGEWGVRVHTFYIKTVPFDRPLRVEFLNLHEDLTRTVDQIASLIYALSSHHDAFGLPSVLIEADACARLAEEDLCVIRDSIADRIGPSSLLDLRRQRRPF